MKYKDLCQVKVMLSSLNKLEEIILQATELHMNHAMVLCAIHTKGPQTPTGLSRELYVSPPRVSRLLNGLSSLGFIERLTDQDDLRSKTIVLTPEGTKKALEVQKLEKKWFPWDVDLNG